MTSTATVTLYKRQPIEGSRVGEDLVIFDDRVGKYFATGPVGADIWDMLDEALSIDAICTRLLMAYDIDEETCRAQIAAFLKRMMEADLVVEV